MPHLQRELEERQFRPPWQQFTPPFGFPGEVPRTTTTSTTPPATSTHNTTPAPAPDPPQQTDTTVVVTSSVVVISTAPEPTPTQTPPPESPSSTPTESESTPHSSGKSSSSPHTSPARSTSTPSSSSSGSATSAADHAPSGTDSSSSGTIVYLTLSGSTVTVSQATGAPTPAVSEDGDQSHGMNAGEKAAIAIVSALVLLLMMLLWFTWRKRRSSRGEYRSPTNTISSGMVQRAAPNPSMLAAAISLADNGRSPTTDDARRNSTAEADVYPDEKNPAHFGGPASSSSDDGRAPSPQSSTHHLLSPRASLPHAAPLSPISPISPFTDSSPSQPSANASSTLAPSPPPPPQHLYIPNALQSPQSQYSASYGASPTSLAFISPISPAPLAHLSQMYPASLSYAQSHAHSPSHMYPASSSGDGHTHTPAVGVTSPTTAATDRSPYAWDNPPPSSEYLPSGSRRSTFRTSHGLGLRLSAGYPASPPYPTHGVGGAGSPGGAETEDGRSECSAPPMYSRD